MSEVRPIDANKLKEVGIDTSLLRADYKEMAEAIFTAMQSAIDAQPTLDYEPVVHCRDCKHLLKRKMLCWHKTNRVFSLGKPVHNNHFCSYGVKMDEEVK